MEQPETDSNKHKASIITENHADEKVVAHTTFDFSFDQNALIP